MGKNILDKYINDPDWDEVMRLYSGLFDTQDERENFILDLAETDILLATECKTSSWEEEGNLKSKIRNNIIDAIKFNTYDIKLSVSLLELELYQDLEDNVLKYLIFIRHGDKKFIKALINYKEQDWLSLIEFLVKNNKPHSISFVLLALLKISYPLNDKSKCQKIYDMMYDLNWKIQIRSLIFISTVKLDLFSDTLHFLKLIISKILFKKKEKNTRSQSTVYDKNRTWTVSVRYNLFSDIEIIDNLYDSQGSLHCKILLKISKKSELSNSYLIEKLILGGNYLAFLMIYKNNPIILENFGFNYLVINLIKSNNRHLLKFAIILSKKENLFSNTQIRTIYDNENDIIRKSIIYKIYGDKILLNNADIDVSKQKFILFFNQSFLIGSTFPLKDLTSSVFTSTGLKISTLFDDVISNKDEFHLLLLNHKVIEIRNSDEAKILKNIDTFIFNVNNNLIKEINEHKTINKGNIVECSVKKIIYKIIFVHIHRHNCPASINIGELTNQRLANIHDFEYNGEKLYIGQKLIAKVISIDEQGRINLSLKQVK